MTFVPSTARTTTADSAAPADALTVLVAAHPTKAPADLEAISRLGILAAGSPTTTLGLAGAHTGWPLSNEGAGNALVPLPRGVCRTIVIAPSLNLFDSPWTNALLSRLHRALTPDGRLIIGVGPDLDMERKGFLSTQSLRRLFDREGDVIAEDGAVRYLAFSGSTKPQTARSVLNWYFDEPGVMLRHSANVYHQREAMAPAVVQAMLQPMLDRPAMLTAEHLSLRGEAKDPTVTGSLNAEAYLLSGLAYKSALLAHLMRMAFGSREIRLLDHGGGIGALAAELLLHPGLRVSQAVCVDVSLPMAFAARSMFDALHEQLVDSFRYRLSRIEDYRYESGERYDLVSFIGSLLYVPRQHTADVLHRAWDALHPGGLLVVHENIKNPSYQRDYEYMFTADELDQFLGVHGTIERYLSTATLPIAAEKVGDRAVFRVVRKASP